MKVFMDMSFDWVQGYLKYGHKEGYVDLTEEEFEEFKKDPKKFIEENDIKYELDFVLDDFCLEDYSDEYEVTYEIVED